jgi:hypothetical protein
VKLPAGISTPELFQLTKPAGTVDDNPISYRGEWLATILVSRTQDSMLWEKALRNVTPLVDELERELKEAKDPNSRASQSLGQTLPGEGEVEQLPAYMLRF